MSFGAEMRDFASSFNTGVDSIANLERARALRSKKGSDDKFDFGADFYKDFDPKDYGFGDDGSDGSIASSTLKPKAAPSSAGTAIAPTSAALPANTTAPYVPPADPNQSPGAYSRGGAVPAYQAGGPYPPTLLASGLRGTPMAPMRPMPRGQARPRLALPVNRMGSGMAVTPAGNIATGYDTGGPVSNISYAFQDGGSSDDYPDDYDQRGQGDVNMIAPNDQSVPYTAAPQGNTPPPAQPLPPPTDQAPQQVGPSTQQPPGPSSAQPAPQPTPSGALPSTPVNPAVQPSRGTAGP